MTAKEEFTAIEIARVLEEKRAREKRVAAYKSEWAKKRHAEYMRGWRVKNLDRAREISRLGSTKYNATNPASKRSQSKKHNDKVRAAIREFFGGKCVRCGFDDPRALQMDHINGGGAKLRRKGIHTSLGARWAVIRDTPDLAREIFQLLCANCNCIKRDEKREYRKVKR